MILSLSLTKQLSIGILKGPEKADKKLLRDVSGGPVGGSLPSELMPCCSFPSKRLGGRVLALLLIKIVPPHPFF